MTLYDYVVEFLFGPTPARRPSCRTTIIERQQTDLTNTRLTFYPEPGSRRVAIYVGDKQVHLGQRPSSRELFACLGFDLVFGEFDPAVVDFEDLPTSLAELKKLHIQRKKQDLLSQLAQLNEADKKLSPQAVPVPQATAIQTEADVVGVSDICLFGEPEGHA